MADPSKELRSPEQSEKFEPAEREKEANTSDSSDKGNFFVRRPIVAMVIAIVTVIVGGCIPQGPAR